MKIFLYCQHVLGMGHFFRALEICSALKEHDVVLVTGGSPVDAQFPDHVREIRLPPLMMDSSFKGIYSPESGKSVEGAKSERKAFLHRYFKDEKPDLFIVELYPFGRKAFRFELDPLLEDIKYGRLPPCKVVCSLRDILVEKEDVDAYETRVVKTLNRYFDALLIHSDPEVLRLDSTFSRVRELSIPVYYTGFVSAMPDNAAVLRYKEMKSKDSMAPNDTMCNCAMACNDVMAPKDSSFEDVFSSIKTITASVGGGSVGHELLFAVVQAVELMNRSDIRLNVFTGPFMDEAHVASLKQHNCSNITIERFSSDFLNGLAASDLSISMAGYNTCMNILAAGVPALVWPFGENREQRLRAELFSRNYPIEILTNNDLTPSTLAEKIVQQLQSFDNPAVQGRAEWRDRSQFDFSGAVIHRYKSHSVDLTGAETSARLIEGLVDFVGYHENDD